MKRRWIFKTIVIVMIASLLLSTIIFAIGSLSMI